MKTYFKVILRSMKSNAARLVSVVFIILLGIAFVSGLGTLSPNVLDSFASRMRACAAADVTVKSVSAQGFSEVEIERFRRDPAVSSLSAVSAVDLKVSERNVRIYALPDGEIEVNRPHLLEGRLPEAAGEIAAEQESDAVAAHSLGDRIELFGAEFEIVGIVANPLLFAREGEFSSGTEEPLEDILYVRAAALPVPLPVTDLCLRLEGTQGLGYFDKNYKELVSDRIESFRSASENESFVFLSLKQNKSCVLLESYCDKVSAITLIFPVFFIAVAALVVLTTTSRMIEEERSSIACCKTLGVGDGKIVFKYVFLSALCCLAASAAGLALGLTLLPRVIYPAFNAIFLMPPNSGLIQPFLGILAAAAMFVAVTAVTVHVIRRELRGQPAELLRPKSPKAGKKIFLERLPVLWSRLSFRNKSSLRNIFRRINHLVMTVLSVAGSTALVFAGFALMNVSKTQTSGSFGGMAESLASISAMIIVFALLLCAFVIYNLTNMNIGERKREIATLKVLGYFEVEVIGYVYREILMTAIFGILIGIGLGCGLIQFVLTYVDFGSLKDVRWYSYLASGGLVLAFIGIVDLLLAPKILSIDMISSLKSVD